MNQSRFLAYTHLKIECMLIMQKKHGYCTLVIVATKYTDSSSWFQVMYKRRMNQHTMPYIPKGIMRDN